MSCVFLELFQIKSHNQSYKNTAILLRWEIRKMIKRQRKYLTNSSGDRKAPFCVRETVRTPFYLELRTVPTKTKYRGALFMEYQWILIFCWRRIFNGKIKKISLLALVREFCQFLILSVQNRVKIWWFSSKPTPFGNEFNGPPLNNPVSKLIPLTWRSPKTSEASLEETFIKGLSNF